MNKIPFSWLFNYQWPFIFEIWEASEFSFISQDAKCSSIFQREHHSTSQEIHFYERQKTKKQNKKLKKKKERKKLRRKTEKRAPLPHRRYIAINEKQNRNLKLNSFEYEIEDGAQKGN